MVGPTTMTSTASTPHAPRPTPHGPRPTAPPGAESYDDLLGQRDRLRETTAEIQRREQELRDKQEQLVQAGKLATLGELTTGVAHELNNPLNNIGLFVGNAIDHLEFGAADTERILRDLQNAMQQVRK